MVSNLCFLPCLCLLLFTWSLPASGEKVESLMMFGDSLLDTGNLLNIAKFPPDPYGETYPGKAAGRMSDGVLFTDILAEYFKIRPVPTPFTSLNKSVPVVPPSGLNFAIVGAGVFVGPGNLGPQVNLAAQVNAFARLVAVGAISAEQVKKSVVVLSVGGNDYLQVSANGTLLSTAFVQQFAPALLNGTWDQLSRLFALGARRFVILNLPPAQCAPRATIRIGNAQCLGPDVVDLSFHNQGLVNIRKRLAVAGAVASLLDLNSAALYVLQNPACFGLAPATILKGCCFGLTPNAAGQSGCGILNLTTFEPLYTLCPSPSTSFFWDTVHFTQAGWKAVSSLFLYSKGYSTPAPSLCKSLHTRCPGPSNTDTNPGAVPLAGYCKKPFKGCRRHRHLLK